jgi:hypothetical protein
VVIEQFVTADDDAMPGEPDPVPATTEDRVVVNGYPVPSATMPEPRHSPIAYSSMVFVAVLRPADRQRHLATPARMKLQFDQRVIGINMHIGVVAAQCRPSMVTLRSVKLLPLPTTPSDNLIRAMAPAG